MDMPGARDRNFSPASLMLHRSCLSYRTCLVLVGSSEETVGPLRQPLHRSLHP